jgi:ubiquinone biosynthesis protein COQ9
MESTYLGDGLYATNIGNSSFMITSGSHILEEADNVVYIGIHELNALNEFVKTKENSST